MTITLQAVNELIASLESAGELSIKERKYLELAKAYQQLAEENVACWSCQNEVEISAIGDCDGYCPNCNSPIDLDEEPCTAPQPAPEREQVRCEHAEWSQATFGNVGPIGPLKHLSKEALEAAAEPGDLSEWADMQFLLWDAQRRAGITDEQITQAMIEKLVVNKQRSWPEPKEGEPRLHIKEQPAQVVPEKATVGEMPFLGTSEGAYVRGWNDCRSAMLQAGNSLEIPEGYVLVPREPTAEMIAAAMDCDDVLFNSDETFCAQFGNIYEAMTAAAPQEVNHG